MYEGPNKKNSKWQLQKTMQKLYYDRYYTNVVALASILARFFF